MSHEVLILAFEGRKSCFLHALLNALDMSEKGFAVSVVMEGESPGLMKEITNEKDADFSKKGVRDEEQS
ncbi:MAG: hypothetical protein XE02_0695 [Mesotoga infera]|uniref:Uncharacterized protein n=1 Tax=Mesotoga infera TaxID=1236046 RepID=A0A101I7F3_9BACT|nr:MAG: hypothetical protein XE02_0695 [Mesotoga infera]